VNRNTRATVVGSILLASVLAGGAAGGEYWDSLDPRDERMRAVMNIPVTLEDGVSVSAHHGTPISAKYTFEDSRLQLFVLTMGTEEFWEVIIDERMGTLRQVGPINGSEDRAAALGHKRAMMMATRSLHDAIVEAVRAHGAYRAVSAEPTFKDGRPVAAVILFDGHDWKTVYVDLNLN
jgi:hypothetical protein